LTTFTLKSPFSAPNQACGPEARALHAKSIGGESIPPEDPVGLPQNGAGRSGARSREAPDAPTSEKPLVSEKERPARPIQETRRASWFLRATPLLPGRAWFEIQSPLHLLGEK